MSLSRRGILAVALPLAVIVTDQLIKFYVKTHFALHETLPVTDWFEIVFTENRGMAFGMQIVGTLSLALFRIAAVAYFLLVLARAVKRRAPYGVVACIALVIAGAAGNIIDNAFYGLVFTESTPFSAPATFVGFTGGGYGSLMTGRVVDMFYFPLFTWPSWMPFVGGNTFFGAIFNFADAAISCGAIALIVFYYRYLSRAGIFSLDFSKKGGSIN